MLGRFRRAFVLAGLVAVAASAVAAGGVSAKPSGDGPGNEPNAKACQKGGWEDLVRSDGSAFASEEECVAYTAQGGVLVDAAVVARCLDGGWENVVRSDGTGFNSEAECRAYAAQGGVLGIKPTEPTLQEQCEQALRDAGLTPPANANYILGTPGDDDFTSQMTAGNDVVCGFAGNDTIGAPHASGNPNAALGAGDIFIGGDGNDTAHTVDGGTFEGGDGSDHVGVIDSGTFNGGAGFDSVTGLDGGTFNGGPGNDDLLQMDGGAFNGGDGHDSVLHYCGGTLTSVETVGACQR